MNRNRGIQIGQILVSLALVAVGGVVTNYWVPLKANHNMTALMIAVVISAFYGGLVPSLVAIAASTIVFAYFVAPPSGFRISDPGDQIRLIGFITVTFLFCFLHAQRLTAEDRVRSMVQRLTLALEGTKLGVWDLDLRSGVVWHSSSLEETFARPQDRFAQSYEVFLGYVHADDRDFVHRTVTRSIQGGDEFHIQYRIVLPSGDVRWISSRGRVFFDEKRHPERLVAVTSDLTNQLGAALPPGSAAVGGSNPTLSKAMPAQNGAAAGLPDDAAPAVA